MTNPCEGCRQNCCDGFFVLKEKAGYLPDFIRVTWSDGAMAYCRCDNYDKKRGVCLDYEHRPDFCRRTATNGNWPHKNCLLKRSGDMTLFDDIGGL